MAAWRYFPCVAGTKEPALSGSWRNHATDDDTVIDGWEAAGYNLAIDCEASGLVVVDDDPGSDITGFDLPETYTVVTPRGGRHRYYLGDAPSTVQKLGPHVDTRGRGGYVLAPPSRTSDGSYSVERDIALAPLPRWIPDALRRTEAAAANVEALDLPINVQRGIKWLADLDEAVQGAGADAATLEAALRLRDLGISADKSIDLMLEHYKCSPQDDRFEAFITRKVENAWEYAQNEAGAWGVTSGSDSFRSYLDSLPADAAVGGDKPDPFHAYTESEQDAFTDPVWLMNDFLPDRTLVMLYGVPGTFKSFIALDAAMTLASGIAGWGQEGGAQRPVVYIAGEGPRSVGRLRRPAWRFSRQVEGETPFHLVTKMPFAAMEGNVTQFIDSILAQNIRPSLVVVDTLARFMTGLNENDAKDCQIAIAKLEQIRDALRCAVLVVHHAGKEDGRGARGSSALTGGFDTLHECIAHKATKAVAVYNRLQKDADERQEPWCFEGQTALKSIVFQPITVAEHRKLTVADEALNGKAVGTILIAMGAINGRTTTTHILASKFHQGAQDESPEDTMAAVAKIERQLVAAARGRLAPYCDRDARGHLTWGMAAAQA